MILRKAKLEASYNDNSLEYTVLFENGIRERNSNYSEDKEVKEQMAEESQNIICGINANYKKLHMD